MNNRRSGAHFLRILNDLKRRPEDAAAELAVPLHEIEAIIAGEKELSPEIIQRATEIWSVNARDFYQIQDDTTNGIKIMRAAASEKSSRTMQRAGQPYYEYRDTAMSTISQFRPEWIMPLCLVDTNEADHENVRWNNGHFLHQFTYFIGPVNFYYLDENKKKHVAVMNTGDSMYITPFVPHSFTTRKNDAGTKGLILALTYGAHLAGDAQHELSVLGSNLAPYYTLDFSTRERAFASLLTFYMEAGSISPEELAARTGLEQEIILSYQNGKIMPPDRLLSPLAEALHITTRELFPPDSLEKKVIVQPSTETRRWNYPAVNPAYTIAELAQTRAMSHSKALELTLQQTPHSDLDLRAGLHQYGYNVGRTPITMNWEFSGQHYSATIHPDDSFYIKPFIPHNFRGQGKILLLRIGGNMTGEAQRELSLFGEEGVRRTIEESTRWYTP